MVMPVLDAADTISVQLEALTRQCVDFEWELVVVDNGCTDASMDIVERFRDRLPVLRVVRAAEKAGPAHARNVGARVASAPFLAFCDADDEVADGWVGAVLEGVMKHGFVASRMDAVRLSEPRALAAKGNRRQQNGLIQYTYVPYLPFAGTCGLAVRREFHERIGGFDESMKFLEDCDYCWRIQLDGTPLVFVPEALVHIRHRTSSSGLYRQARNWGQYNVALLKRYRLHGMPKPRWTTGVRLWWRLVRQLPSLRSQGGRDRWVWGFGYRVGQLRGSFTHRMFAP